MMTAEAEEVRCYNEEMVKDYIYLYYAASHVYAYTDTCCVQLYHIGKYRKHSRMVVLQLCDAVHQG